MWKEIIIFLTGAILSSAIFGYYNVAGVLALILLGISLIYGFKSTVFEEKPISLLREEGQRTILEVVSPRAPRALEPIPLKMKIKNPLNTKGLRIRFHSMACSHNSVFCLLLTFLIVRSSAAS